MQAPELVGRPSYQAAFASGDNCPDGGGSASCGLLLGKGGFYGNVIRMSPPLNISKADVDDAARVLDESFAALKK